MAKRKRKNKKYSSIKLDLKNPLVVLFLIIVIIIILVIVLYEMGILEKLGINIPFLNKEEEKINNKDIEYGENGDLKVIALEMHGTYGDSFIIKKGNYEVLVDAGTPSDKDYVKDALELYVTDDKLDLLVISHMHNDHYGSLDSDDFFSSIGISVLNIVDNGMVQSTKIHTEYTSLRNTLITSGAKYYPIYNIIENNNTKWYLDSSNEAYIMFFDTGYYKEPESTSTKDPNDFSVCMGLSYLDTKYFFGGDLPTTCEQSLINNIDKVDSNFYSKDDYVVYKTCHHGSKTSNSTLILDYLHPDLIFSMSGIISKNQGTSAKKDQHPFIETLNRIKPYTLNVYWTGINGTIIMSSDGKNVSLKFLGRTVDYYYNGVIVDKDEEKNINIYNSKWYKELSGE